MLKMWAISFKTDKLWVQRIHAVYIKDQQIMNMNVPTAASYFFKKVMKLRILVLNDVDWAAQLNEEKFCMRKIYNILRPPNAKVDWRGLLFNNIATPKAKFILWLTLKNKLATKERLSQFMPLSDLDCIFCNQNLESVSRAGPVNLEA